MRPITVVQDGVGNSAPIPLDIFRDPFNVTVQCVITGAPTFTVEYTCDDPAAPVNWFPLAGITNAVANAVDSLISPVTAIRLRQTAGAAGNGVTMRVIQAGLPS